jgi:8-demethyl-8-alpha-L-rhamnosyltetracenomycin-C 2'-O-methyltransferase
MTELCELALKYRVDKCPQIYHTYTPEYHKILHPLRNSVTKIVEIGIGNYPLMANIAGKEYKHGASLFMWRDYFPHAQIIGCDILKEVQFNEERITTYVVDQSNEDSLKDFSDIIKDVDILLDDGSHVESHMILSFKQLWRNVKRGGLYIIEDIKSHSLNLFETLPTILGLHDAELVVSHPGKNSWDSFVIFKKN